MTGRLRHAPARRRTSRSLATGSAGVLVVGLVLAGCTIRTSDDEPTEEASPAPSTGATGEEGDTADGVAPEELSAQVLTAAEEAAASSALGEATGPLQGGDGDLLVEVVSLARVDEGTLLELRLAGDGDGDVTDIGTQEFASTRFGSLSFIRDVYLDDAAVTDTRYRPLQFEDHRDACVCPTLPLKVGPEPQIVYALFPELPDSVETVRVQLADSDIRIEDVPLDG